MKTDRILQLINKYVDWGNVVIIPNYIKYRKIITKLLPNFVNFNTNDDDAKLPRNGVIAFTKVEDSTKYMRLFANSRIISAECKALNIRHRDITEIITKERATIKKIKNKSKSNVSILVPRTSKYIDLLNALVEYYGYNDISKGDISHISNDSVISLQGNDITIIPTSNIDDIIDNVHDIHGSEFVHIDTVI